MTGHTPNPLPDLPRPTKAYHKTVYPYVSPNRPELNLSGKTVFITGGGSLHTHTYSPSLHFMFDVVYIVKQKRKIQLAGSEMVSARPSHKRESTV